MVAPLAETVALTKLLLLSRSEKVVVETDEGLTGSLRVAVISEDVAIPVAALAGEVVLTTGGAVSGAKLVVKLQLKFVCRALPERSVMPVVSVAV